MALQLRIDEMLEALWRLEHPDYADLKAGAETLAELMARRIEISCDVQFGSAVFEGMAFAGLCASFYPKYEGQKLPEALEGLDDEGWEE